MDVTNALNMAAYTAIVNDKSNVYDGKTIGGMMKTEAEWAEDVKRLLRAEMTRRGVTYEELADGWPRSELRIRRSTCATRLHEDDSPRFSLFNVSPR